MLDFEHVAKMPKARRRLFTALRELHLQLPLNLPRMSSFTLSCFSDNLFFFMTNNTLTNNVVMQVRT